MDMTKLDAAIAASNMADPIQNEVDSNGFAVSTVKEDGNNGK